MVRYVTEPRRGRQLAAETAITTALQLSPDFIAYLDDDDRPDPGWLKHLIEEQRRTSAGIVFGAWRQTLLHPRLAGPGRR